MIRCEGPAYAFWLNGTLTVDYKEEEKIERTGIIGLQIHGGGKAKAYYKDIRIEECRLLKSRNRISRELASFRADERKSSGEILEFENGARIPSILGWSLNLVVTFEEVPHRRWSMKELVSSK